MIKVLLADDQALLRAGFRALLDAQADIEVVGEAIDGADAVRQVAPTRDPDVVLMDIRMPRHGRARSDPADRRRSDARRRPRSSS